MEEFKKLYGVVKERIDNELSRVMKDREPTSLYEPADYIMDSPGKRIRPVLVMFSAKAVGGTFDEVLHASLAVEMLHNFTLVHDDIMDNSDKRRGVPTLHIKYDLSTAILTGDVLLAAAYEYLQKDLKGNAKAVEHFTRGLIEVCEGQSLDKDFEVRELVSLDEYLEMIGKKTAALSRMCCAVGAILGGGSDAEVEALANYGFLIGLAFQIQDDLLDITADSSALGKPVGGDLLEGKKTFLFLKALEKSSGSDRIALEKIAVNKGAKPDEIGFYRDLFERLGVLDDAKNEVEKLTIEALGQLVVLKNQEDIGLFTALANSLLNRTK
ncbi:polyprenyl synthetase family protein [Ignavibacteriales bacterium]